MTRKLEIIGEGSLYLGGSGKKTRDLESDPIALENRPPPVGSGFDTSYLLQYDGTNFVQWHGRKSDGRFHPWGKIMRIIDK